MGRREDPGDEAIAELRALGAAAQADRVEAMRPRDDFAIYGRKAWGTLRLFLAASTQWRTASLSSMAGGRLVFLGLDYAGVEAAARMAGIEITPRRSEEIRDMETAALRILNEHR